MGGRSVFVLGSCLRTPDASSRVRRPMATESSSESLAVVSFIAGGVGVMYLPWRGSGWVGFEEVGDTTRPKYGSCDANRQGAVLVASINGCNGQRTLRDRLTG